MVHSLSHYTQRQARYNALAALRALEIRARDHKEAQEALEQVRLRVMEQRPA